ncbi:uncharacterized protein LOC144378023 [Ictidomys tridecemlineatus]
MLEHFLRCAHLLLPTRIRGKKTETGERWVQLGKLGLKIPWQILISTSRRKEDGYSTNCYVQFIEEVKETVNENARRKRWATAKVQAEGVGGISRVSKVLHLVEACVHQ